MTPLEENKQKVINKYPKACVVVQQGHFFSPKVYMIWETQFNGRCVGTGFTEGKAWADAAASIK